MISWPSMTLGGRYCNDRNKALAVQLWDVLLGEGEVKYIPKLWNAIYARGFWFESHSYYMVFHRFGKAKLSYGGWVLG